MRSFLNAPNRLIRRAGFLGQPLLAPAAFVSRLRNAFGEK
jgi:hypothetical protein